MEELEIILNGEIVNIKIIRKNNKNIYFRFNDQNELVVTVHPRISTKKVLKLIKENEKSLAKMYMRIKNKQDREDETRILGLKYDIKINENYHRAYLGLGLCFDKIKKYTLAVRYYKKYITLKPHSDTTKSLVGRIYEIYKNKTPVKNKKLKIVTK